MMQQYGHFSEKTFVITEKETPRHWYNYLYNDEYITFISQVGFGMGFPQDKMGRRINAVDDRTVYVVDGKDFWQTMGLPIYDDEEEYACTHGIGYTDIMRKKNGIRTKTLLFVPSEGKREVLRVTVTNESDSTRTLKVIPYYATGIDCRYAPQGYETGNADICREKNAVYGVGWSTFETGKQHRVYAYLHAIEEVTGYDTRRNAFIGTYGSKNDPQALIKHQGCTNSDCIAEKVIFALENECVLAPNESHTFYYIAGVEHSLEDIPCDTAKELELQFEEMQKKYKDICGKVSVKTPWDNLNGLFNDWLKYQTNMGSRWARVRHNGFRDLTSDTECLGCINAPLAADRLARVMTYQYENGYAPRTFLDGKVQDKNFSDNTVWLVFAAHAITKELGDASYLTRDVPFNNGASASIYEHVKRSVEFLWNFTGHHGLVKIWGGDWNDGMCEAGNKGVGVSIWLSIAFVRAAKMLSQMAEWLGKDEDAKLASEYATTMTQRINEFGWDGDRYLYAISDDKIPIGSKENEEGSLHALPQLWSILADLDPERGIIAMDTLEHGLNTDLGLLVCAPPYTEYHHHVGPMCRKYPGVHENGGVYLHAAVWKLAVDSLLGRNDKVEEGLRKILPDDHKYYETCGEPYAMFNSYLGKETGYRAGKPGQSWRTASGQWLLYSLVRFIYGLQPEFDGLLLRPCLPTSWKDCHITKNFRDCEYRIHYQQTEDGGCNRIGKLTVNGKEADPTLPIRPVAGAVLDIEVTLVK